MLLLKSLLAWLAILALAFANGALREFVLIPWLGPVPGLLLSGLLLSACILAVAAILARSLPATRAPRLLAVGLLWLLLTLAFEFGFGRLVQGKSWAELMAAYRFAGGNAWPLVLLTTLLAPWIAARFYRWNRSTDVASTPE